ncbi:hypothetical protein [Rhizobium leguminosarum]|uniref:hypothetical protein n=1 Tax=Rhizobium leguminosarum TaxID=384 RepID=UPI00144180D7|nr:hypothetical protein [Rhizobium leguminosarum]NKL66279.1 hypothetical protein [Rhizobium leguminosarum bv. viciae]
MGLVLVELDKAKSGQRLQPTIDAFINELPAIEWPADWERHMRKWRRIEPRAIVTLALAWCGLHVQISTPSSALNDGNDVDWRTRELIIMPSHVSDASALADIQEMMECTHGAGFDIISGAVDQAGN